MLNCDQLPLTLTAFANWPPSTLYCTTEIGACGLVAEPVNTNGTGTCAATIGEVNGAEVHGRRDRREQPHHERGRDVQGLDDLLQRPGRTGTTRCAFTVSCTIDPHGVAGLTVPVHCQLLPLGNVPATSWPPGPNCTLMLLLISVQFAGVENEMLPRNWNVRSTVGRPPVGT